MVSQAWEDLVAEGVRLREVAETGTPVDRWVLGDLCVEAIPPGTGRAEVSANQRQLADLGRLTGFPVSLLKDVYRTSKAWPPGTRIVGESHSKHSTYAARPDRVTRLLNDGLDDGLAPRLRDRIDKVEKALADPELRLAVLERSHTRNRRIQTAAKAIENEELTQARVQQRIQEQDAKAKLAAPGLQGTMAERAIKGNASLAKMITELIDLTSVVNQIPTEYHKRTAENLAQIVGAAQRALDKLRPVTRSPQPRHVIDLTVADTTGAEHQ